MSVFPSKVNFVTGDILTATDVNEIGQAINLLDGAQRSAGKNAIINGDFGIWQRGTSFTPSAAWNYNADRFAMFSNGTGTTPVVSRQTFTPGTAPVAGYEGTYFWRYSQAAAGSGNTINWVQQRIEDVRQFAGQTVTLSFWGKADAARTVACNLSQNFGSGGSGDVSVGSQNNSFTTAWQRFTFTVAVPSITGKTVGTNSFLIAEWNFPVGVAQTIDIWGVQLEYANTASNFQTATGTKQGELAACQRYYWRTSNPSAYVLHGTGLARSATEGQFQIVHPISMRVAPTSVEFSTLAVTNAVALNSAITGLTLSQQSSQTASVYTSGSSGLTADRVYFLANNNSTAAYIAFSAEL
jgi:hypothetical protein